MITKAAIKYKILEWALDTFVSKIFLAFDLGGYSGRFRIGEKFKKVHSSGAVIYGVTVVKKGNVGDFEDGYHFIYKYIKYFNNGYYCFCIDGGMQTMSEDEFLNTYGFRSCDIFDDLDLYLSEEEIQKSKFIP